MGKILAHELAHVFGVQHDGENGKNKCSEKMTANRSKNEIVVVFVSLFTLI
jgi:hypothetical protein